MYVEQLKSGRWAVCEDDSSIVCEHASKSAATRHLREIKAAIRYDEQADADEAFLRAFRD